MTPPLSPDERALGAGKDSEEHWAKKNVAMEIATAGKQRTHALASKERLATENVA